MLDPLEGLRQALADRYIIDREIGHGGSAIVYLAQERNPSRPVAIKVLAPELALAVRTERFLLEIEIAARLQHPHILTVHSSGEAAGLLYYVMPYVAGETLRDRLDRTGRLPLDEAIRITQEVATALTHAHEQGVVHRDIKPENIMFSAGLAVVTDFGIARVISEADPARLTQTGGWIGTPDYMSPEQASGEMPDGRSDIYSLGCVLYEMLAGQAPFAGPNAESRIAQKFLRTPEPLSHFRPDVPIAIQRALKKALQKTPDERFQLASEFANALFSKHGSKPAARGKSPSKTRAGQRPAVPDQGPSVVLSCQLTETSDAGHTLDLHDRLRILARSRAQIEERITRCDGRLIGPRVWPILALFDSSVAHEDAIGVGLEIAGGLAHSEPGAVVARVGIAYGTVSRARGGAHGEAVDLAHKIRGNTDPGSVVVTEAVKRLAAGRFEYDDQGVGNPPVFRIAGRSALNRFEAATLEGRTPFVGRTEEMHVLRDSWRQVKAGTGQVLLLIGKAGIGKSRIVTEFIASLDKSVSHLSFEGSHHHINSPFHPYIDSFERMLTSRRGESSEATLQKIREHAASVYECPEDSADPHLAYIAAALSLPASDPSIASMGPRRRKDRTIDAFVDLTKAFARKPAVMRFEDVQWVDPTTLDILDETVKQVGSWPLLVLITSRPVEEQQADGQIARDYASRWSPYGHVKVMPVKKLEPQQRQELQSQVRGSAALPAKLLEEIVEKSDGVPLFLEELVKDALENDALEPERVRTPPKLDLLLKGRLARVRDVKEIAQIGAAIGREFSHDLIAAVIRTSRVFPSSRLADRLKKLTQSGLARARGTGRRAVYTFKHDLVRVAAYELISESDPQKLKNLHAAIAQVLEQRGGTSVPEPELLAHHYREAGLHERAGEYWKRAGELAFERYALQEAEAHARAGIGSLEHLAAGPGRDLRRLELLELLGRTLLTAHGWADPEVQVTLAVALDLAKALNRPDKYQPVFEGLWVHHMSAGKHDTALDLALEAEETARASGNRGLELVARRALMTSNFWIGKFDETAKQGDLIRKMHEQGLDEGITTLTSTHPYTAYGIYEAQRLWIQGSTEEAVRLTETAHRWAREHKHPFNLGLVLTLGAQVYDYCGDAPKLLECAEEAERVCSEHHLELLSKKMAQIVKGIAWLRGDRVPVAESVTQLRESLDSLWNTGHRAWLPYIRALLAEALAKTGDLDGALVEIDKSLAHIEDRNERAHEAEVLRLKGCILWDLGRRDEAEVVLHHAKEVAHDQGAKSWEARVSTAMASRGIPDKRREEPNGPR